MLRVSASLVLMVTLVCVCLSAGIATKVMEISSANKLVLIEEAKLEDQCPPMGEHFFGGTLRDTAKELYKKAVSLSFDKDWLAAQRASRCAAWYDHGAGDWKFNVQDLVF